MNDCFISLAQRVNTAAVEGRVTAIAAVDRAIAPCVALSVKRT